MINVERPLFEFAIAVEWQACMGGSPIGPRRSFMIDAISDLPKEARVTVNLSRQTYQCNDYFRVAPRHAFQHAGEGPLLWDSKKDFRQRRSIWQQKSMEAKA